MSDVPERHPEIPADAVWLEELEKWEVVARDEAGIKEGECRLLRTDGRLYMLSQYVAGVQEGGFTAYHPDGRVAREGRYLNGELVGPLVAYAPDGDDGEPLRPCCVPANAWQMRAEYDRGQALYQRFFDREGHALLSDGSICPTPPPGLPARADFDEGDRRWAVSPAAEDPGSARGVFTARRARSLEEARFEEGFKVLARFYAADGTVKQETHFNRSGRRHGAHRRRFIEGRGEPLPRRPHRRGAR